MLNNEERLPENIIITDSDSYLVATSKNVTLNDEINDAILHMHNNNNIDGMAFRMDPVLLPDSNLLQKSQYVEYIGTRFLNHCNSKQKRLWVINGPGGIFHSNVLLKILRNMKFDFETGDIAKLHNCSRPYILLLLKKYNLPIRTKSAARAEAKKNRKFYIKLKN